MVSTSGVSSWARRDQGRVGADAVVLAVAQDHGAVEAHVAGGAGGYDLDLGGEEVLLLDVVLFLDEVEEHLLDGLLDLLVAFDDDGHGAVEAHVAGGAGGYDLDLGGEEVLLLDVVLFLDEVEEHLLDGLLDLLVAFDDDGTAGNDDIEVLMVDGLAGGLLHLIACEVDQQVGDAEDRIGRVLAHGDIHRPATMTSRFSWSTALPAGFSI